MPGFNRLQALDTDAAGRLHVLDSYGGVVLIFNPATGAYLAKYGSYGAEPGQLKLPKDVLVSQPGVAIVTAGDGDRIEVFVTP